MVTKLASLYFSGNDCFSAKSCKGYKTAILEITVASGSTASFVSRITKDNTVPTIQTPTVAKVYTQEGFVNTTNLSEGTYKFYLDITGATGLLITRSGSFSYSSLMLSQDEFVIPDTLDKTTKHIVINNEVKLIDTTTINSFEATVTASLASGSANLFCQDANNNYIPYSIMGCVVNGSTQIETGIYYIKVDCRNTDYIKLFANAPAANQLSYSIDIVASSELIDLNKEVNANILNAHNGGMFKIEKGKQVDLTVHAENPNQWSRIKIEGSNNNEDWTNIPFYHYELNKYFDNDALYIRDEKTIHLFANTDGYEYLRVNFTPNNNTACLIIEDVKVYKENLEGRTIAGGFQSQKASIDKANTLFKGYKFFKIKLLKNNLVNGNNVVTNLTNCDGYILVLNNGETVMKNLVYYDRGMNLAPGSVLFLNRWSICGTPTEGGFVIETKQNYDNLQFVPQKARSITGNEFALAFEIECYVNKPEPETYLVKKYEKNDYSVYQLPSSTANRDVLNADILEWSNNSLTFWHGGYLGIRYDIPFNENTVANYNGESISFAYLLPFKNPDARATTDYTGVMFTYSRICVFTDKRVFHNYPYRTVGEKTFSDIGKFDESTIYNDAKQWIPVNDKTKVSSIRKYFPVLAEYDYDQFEGRIGGTTGFVDVYGNGGLPSNAVLLDNVKNDALVFWRLKYSNMTKTTKMCAFGNYNVDEGTEPFVMISNDGGKTWYIKAYFACTDDYAHMRGGKVDLKPITDVAPYVTNSLKMCRKKFNLPSDAVKEPTTPFIVDANDQSLVTGFSTDANGNCIVTVADNIDYNGLFPIVYFENVNANSEWDYICNTGFTADGTTNNGIFFRVEKISANQYRLFGDLGNPFEGNMVCRHIHAVNGVEAGVLISTGESYSPELFEGGFLYLLVQNYKNGGQAYNVGYGVNETIRLSSSPDGVNRACGAYLFSDNDDPTLLWVSDAAYPPHLARSASIDGRTISVPITPAGIFVGKLSEIDDLTKFKCVCELHTTVVGLVQANGHFAADGHGNAIMFSKDGFNWNIEVDDGSAVNGFDNYGNIYFGDKVVMFK